MVKILEKRTEKDPLQHIGENAGICWGADISNIENNIKRAKTCMKSRHLRTSEYPTVELIIDEISARCIREAYTHIIGVTRLQESTRYVNCEDFKYYNPCTTNEQKELYDSIMNMISVGYKQLLDLGVSKEDSANVLPLGMNSKFVWKINVRALIHFMNERLCSRAYKEIRQLSNEIKKLLSEYSEEWKWICDNYFVPKCKSIGYCQEEKCCGLMPKGLEGLKEQWKKEIENKSKKTANDKIWLAVEKSPFYDWFYEMGNCCCEVNAYGKRAFIESTGDKYSLSWNDGCSKIARVGLDFDELVYELNELYKKFDRTSLED